MAPTLNIFDIWQKILSEMNVQQSGQIRPVTDYQNWMNAINSEYFNDCVAEYELNQMNSDILMPFTVRKNVIVTPVPGQPYDRVMFSGIADYEYFKGMRVLQNLLEEEDIIQQDGTCLTVNDADYAKIQQQYFNANKYEGDVIVVNSDRWSARLSNSTKKPTLKKPACTQDSQGFLIAPKGIQSVVVEYFRTPRPCVFAYTIGTGDIVVYNAGGSTQLEWPNVTQNEFLVRLGKKYGLRVRDAEVFQASMANKKDLV